MTRRPALTVYARRAARPRPTRLLLVTPSSPPRPPLPHSDLITLIIQDAGGGLLVNAATMQVGRVCFFLSFLLTFLSRGHHAVMGNSAWGPVRREAASHSCCGEP